MSDPNATFAAAVAEFNSCIGAIPADFCDELTALQQTRDDVVFVPASGDTQTEATVRAIVDAVRLGVSYDSHSLKSALREVLWRSGLYLCDEDADQVTGEERVWRVAVCTGDPGEADFVVKDDDAISFSSEPIDIADSDDDSVPDTSSDPDYKPEDAALHTEREAVGLVAWKYSPAG